MAENDCSDRDSCEKKNGLYSSRSFSSYGNGKYRGESQWRHPGIIESLSIARDFLFKGGETLPSCRLPVKRADLGFFTTDLENQLNSTLIGHSSLLIHIDGYRIITDPVFEKSVSIVGPKRYNGDLPLDVTSIPDVDAVIISHNHYDHLNRYSVQSLKDKAACFIVPSGIGDILSGWGVKRKKIVELDWWQEYYYKESLMIAATPARHFSGRGLFDRNATLWASWVVAGPSHRFYFSGDSGYFKGFSEAGDHYGPFDMTFLECGAYDRKWRSVHMFPEETVRAHMDLGGNLLHPIHWGTFNLALHAWYEPMERFAAAAEKAGIRYVTPETGESVVFESRVKRKEWWKEYIK